MSTLSGKTALVTGGASGIGRATALALAEAGAAVVVVDLNAAQGAEVVSAIELAGGKAVLVAGDVRRPPTVSARSPRRSRRSGGSDVLFNNAGIIRRASVVDTTEAEWDRVMAVNVKSIFLM